MDGNVRSEDGTEETGAPAGAAVQAHESRPGRTVFTEDGNTDAWIASDLVVDLQP